MSEVLPQITTVIPTFRRPRLLRRALRSVLNQTYPHFRVGVYDDASGDETPQVVAEVAQGDPRVQYHCHPKNIGMSPNFRFAMERVKTPYFSFLSDDDLLLPDFYHKALEGFERFPEAGCSALGVILMKAWEGLGVLSPPTWPEGLCRPPEGLRNMVTMYQPAWIAILFRRELIEKVGLPDPEIFNVDQDYILRVLAHHPMVFSRYPGAVGYAHTGSLSVRARLEDLWPGNMKVIRKVVDDTSLDPDLRKFASQAMMRTLKRRLFVDCGLRAIIEARGEEARRSADVLSRELGQVWRAGLLRFLDGVHRVFPPLRQVSLMAFRLRKRWQRSQLRPAIKRQVQTFREFEHYLSSDQAAGG